MRPALLAAVVAMSFHACRAAPDWLNIKFENEGRVTSDMQFTSVNEPCRYLEPESPTKALSAWAIQNSCPLLYRQTSPANGDKCIVGTPAPGQDRPGGDSGQYIVPHEVADPAAWCGSKCCATRGCQAYVYAVAPKAFGACRLGQRCCYLKDFVTEPKKDPACQSGVVDKPVPEVAAPPLGMRSAPPLGGWTTGSMELRADGSFREVTILNQSPADNPKWGRQDGFSISLALAASDGSGRTARMMRTHPPMGVKGVDALRFSGAYPVTRLTVDAADKEAGTGGAGNVTAAAGNSTDPDPADSLVGTELYGFGHVSFGSLAGSAKPAISLVAKPAAASGATLETLVTIPLAEQDLSRLDGGVVVANGTDAPTPMACLAACNDLAGCQSWTLHPSDGCTLLANAPAPLPFTGSWSGTRTSVTTSGGPFNNYCCVKVNKTTGGSMSGTMDACVGTCRASAVLTGTLDSVFAAFESGAAESAGDDNGGIPVAGIRGYKRESTDWAFSSISWDFPHRLHTGEKIGNQYRAVQAGDPVSPQTVQATLYSYQRVHEALRPSGMPLPVRDATLQMLNHFRMPIWTANGRVRSFEAYDCVNIDSVHNDGERAVPYLMAMPEFAESKLTAWAAGQLGDGMIQEQLGCGCTGGVPPLTDKGCGRNMSDVSSMFLVYLVHMAQGNRMSTVSSLWPNAKAAAKWQIAQSETFGVPAKLQTTYDVLGLNAYDTCTYSSLFHILAMRSCSFLANKLGDAEQAAECDGAATRAQAALDARHWVEDGLAPPKGAPSGPGPWPMYRSYCDGGSETECPAGHPNATMADSTYPQVIAYSLGFGSLVANETRLRMHLKTVAQRHETPYGMLIMVGRELPYPGTDRDNAVWMMASPNWASLALYSGLTEGPDAVDPWPTLTRSLSWWRGNDTGTGGKGASGVAARNAGGLADLWNIAGVTGGVQNANTGAPWITSHYGYTLTAWRTYLALSGQVVDLSTGAFSFDPKPGRGDQEGVWPVVLVGALGKLNLTSSDGGSTMTASLSLASSGTQPVPISSLRIGDHVCPIQPGQLSETPIQCTFTV